MAKTYWNEEDERLQAIKNFDESYFLINLAGNRNACSVIEAGMKWICFVAIVGVLELCGCSPASRSPDAIRQNTANATAAAARDTKAVAQGVFDGLRAKGPLNINRASKEQLETLPGIDSAAADRIISGRPYKNSAELERRHILSRAEYNRIANRIEAR